MTPEIGEGVATTPQTYDAARPTSWSTPSSPCRRTRRRSAACRGSGTTTPRPARSSASTRRRRARSGRSTRSRRKPTDRAAAVVGHRQRRPDLESLRSASNIPADGRRAGPLASRRPARRTSSAPCCCRTTSCRTSPTRTDVPVDQSASALDSFLNDKSGYCQQFAATMALMARSLGHPVPRRRRLHPRHPRRRRHLGRAGQGRARLARAVVPRRRLGPLRADPAQRRRRRQRHRPGLRHRRCRPGSRPPRRARGRRRRRATPSSTSCWPRARPAPPRSTGPTPAPAPTVAAARPRRPASWWRLLVGAVPAAWRWLRRRRRLSATASVEDAWEELRDTARDLGIEWSDARTPRQAVATVIERQHLSGEVAEAATRVGTGHRALALRRDRADDRGPVRRREHGPDRPARPGGPLDPGAGDPAPRVAAPHRRLSTPADDDRPVGDRARA